MAEVHRVYVHMPHAEEPTAPGHPLYLPEQGAGRIDSPDGRYRVWYCAEDWRVAVCEKFRDFGVWSGALLAVPPGLPAGSGVWMATLRGAFELCDLDNASTLGRLGIRPSRVVTGNREETQAWAAAIQAGTDARLRSDGATWWCHWNSDFEAAGIWNLDAAEAVSHEPLTLDHLAEAAVLLNRPMRR